MEARGAEPIPENPEGDFKRAPKARTLKFICEVTVSFISLQLVLNGVFSIFYYQDGQVSVLNVWSAHPLHPVPPLQLFITLSIQGFSLQVHSPPPPRFSVCKVN